MSKSSDDGLTSGSSSDDEHGKVKAQSAALGVVRTKKSAVDALVTAEQHNAMSAALDQEMQKAAPERTKEDLAKINSITSKVFQLVNQKINQNFGDTKIPET